MAIEAPIATPGDHVLHLYLIVIDKTQDVLAAIFVRWVTKETPQAFSQVHLAAAYLVTFLIVKTVTLLNVLHVMKATHLQLQALV